MSDELPPCTCGGLEEIDGAYVEVDLVTGEERPIRQLIAFRHPEDGGCERCCLEFYAGEPSASRP